MFEKCPTCRSRILGGGRRFLKWTFCSEGCESRFKVALTDRLMAPEAVAQQIRQVFDAECPSCHRFAHNNVWTTTTVTGILVLCHVAQRKHVCCAQCARKKSLLAAAHCLFFGWWSPHAALANVVLLPTSLFAMFYIKDMKSPSVALTEHVKARLAEQLAPQLHAEAMAREREAENDEAPDGAPEWV